MIRVVSGFSPEGYEEYGRNFIRTFDKHWPSEIELVLYVEERIKTGASPRVAQRDLWQIPGIANFIEIESQVPEHCGRAPVDGWRMKEHLAGYSWRHDAVRFCRQLYIPEHAAAELSEGDILVWLDGDVVTFADVPEDLIERLLGNHSLIYLGRTNGSTELGFWAVRISDYARIFLGKLSDMCGTGAMFRLPEWHSAYVFDRVREQYKQLLPQKSLVHNGHGHVWFDCEIGQYTDHIKGFRKKLGYSPERFRQRHV